MQDIILSLVNSYGYFGIFFLIAIENIFPPIPSEVILTFAGFLTTYTRLSFFISLMFSVLGSMLGAIILYLAGSVVNKNKLEKILSGKIGNILRLKPSDVKKADIWFVKKGNKAVFFCRFVPVVRSLISIPAGMNQMRFTKFLIYTLLGTTIWNFVLMFLGRCMGSNWSKISNFISNISDYVLILIVLLIIILLIKHYSKNKKEIID